MKRITKDTEVERFLRKTVTDNREKARTSPERRDNLEGFIRLRTAKPNISLRFTENHSTAAVDYDREEDEYSVFVAEDSPLYEENEFDLPDAYWDSVIQRGYAIHEGGHILYTDHVEFQDVMDSYHDPKTFKTVFNILEDGYIEHGLRNRFRVSEEIDLLRESASNRMWDTLDTKRPRKQGEDRYHMYLSQAVQALLYDMTVWDTGKLASLLDKDDDTVSFITQTDKDLFYDLVPFLDDLTDEYLEEHDGTKRIDIAYNIAELISDKLEESDSPRSKDGMENMQGEIMPDDASGDSGGQLESPDVQPGSGLGDGEESPLDEGGADGVEMPDRIEDSVEREMKKEQLGEEYEALEEEIKDYVQSMSGGSGDRELYWPEPESPSPETMGAAKKNYKRISMIAGNQLLVERRQNEVSGRYSGKFDSDKMMKAEAGYPNVFYQTEEGGDKDYSCIIIRDRSGSMTGSKSRKATEATGTLSLALEDIGVDTSILDVYTGRIALTKPFTQSTERTQDNIFDTASSGGTPLRHAVWFARQRIDAGDGRIPFIIVITDGAPHKTSKYMDELGKCNFPVLGVYITNSSNAKEEDYQKQLQYFHRATVVGKGDSLKDELAYLARGMVIS